MANIPDAAIEFLLENVKEFIQRNLELLNGANENFEKLCKELDLLKVFLQEWSEKYDNKILENLANSVRDLVHRAEDVIETFIVETAKQKHRGKFDQFIHKAEYKLQTRNLAIQIETISKEVQDFYTNKAKFGLEALALERLAEADEEPKNLKPRVDDLVVGLEDEAEKVIGLLTKGPDQLDVVSIFGMLGLGKTTLAKKVLTDPKIEYHFFIRAFVEVSHNFKKKEVLLNIASTFTEVTNDIRKKSEDQLVEFINKNLQKRKYLIVLDDVWTKDVWEALKYAFPNNDKCCRVLITTRHEDVAENVKNKTNPHKLRFLHDEESQLLLRLKVFQENVYRANLVGHEKSILKRCKGLPLAIVVIAGILRNHRDQPEWWRKVADGVADYDHSVKEKAEYVIKLSFDVLPYHLKPCFLYLGVFPEDSEISVKRLLRLWISEGFIPPPRRGNLTLEDVAEFYLQMLVDRSLVMVEKRRSNGLVKTIKIHDTLRDFCKERGQKENLFHEIWREQVSSMTSNTNRRLSVNSDVQNFINGNPSGKYVRSFLCFAQGNFVLPKDKVTIITKNFQLLRVLEIRPLKLAVFPPELYCLILLKYISISSDFKTLPEKLSSLWNLETLIIQTTAHTFQIKANIWKMPQLRHLDVNASTHLPTETKKEPSKTLNLQTLSTISPESCTDELFDKIPMIKKLGIRGKLAPFFEPVVETKLFTRLSKLQSLENLKLLNDPPKKIQVLPGANHFPRKLSKLTLSNTFLDWKHMSTLGNIENLQVLKLKDNAFEGEKWDTEDGGFNQLSVFYIGATDLTDWNAAASNFPILTHLYLRNCSHLESIPFEIVKIPTLRIIDIHCCKPSVATSARKLQVVPQVGKKFELKVFPTDQ